MAITVFGRLLGAFGFMALALYAMLALVLPETPGISWVGATAAVGISAWVYLDWDALSRFFGSRSGREQLMSLALMLVVGGICGLVLHLSDNNPKQWDLTEGGLHSLDERTQQILRDVPDELDVSVTGFYVSSFDSLDMARRKAFGRLTDAAEGTGSKIDFELYDPELSPMKASRAGVTSNGTVVVTARPRGSKSDADVRTERLNNPDESQLVNALTRVIHNRRAKVYFVVGHGERSHQTAGDAGVTLLGQHLTNLGFGLGTWSSPKEAEVPADATVLVVAGPRVPLDAREADLIRGWVEDGGSLMLLSEPTLPGQEPYRTGMEGALLSWGLRLRDDLVLDEAMARLGGDPAVPIADKFAYHEITAGFELGVVFLTARSVVEDNNLPEQVTTFELARTGDSAWGETDLASEAISVDETDNPGPITLVALAELHRPDSDARGRILVAGDTDWVSDAMITTLGNLDFASRSVGFLAKAEDVIKIPPREKSAQTMELTGLEMLLTVFLTVVAVPGGAALLGFIVFIWRKSL